MLVVEACRAKAFGEEQCAGRGQQCGNTVTGHVTGGEGSLAAVVGNFQAIGVDRDVLCRRSEGHDHGDRDQPGQVFLRVAETHPDQAENDQCLGKDQPGTSTPQLAEQWQAPLVEQRRPHPFKGIGQTDQACIANGFASHTGFAQPDRKC